MITLKYEPTVWHILKIFVLVFFLVPFCFAFMLFCTIGIEKIKAIARMVVIFAPPLIIIVSVRFMILNNKLDRCLKDIKNETISDRKQTERFINSYPLRAAITILIIISAGPLIVGVAGFKSDILFSWQETYFFFFMGQSLAFLAAAIIYYQAKIKLYSNINKIGYKPLSLFEKISIPIISILIIILIFTSCFLYRISIRRYLILSNENIGITLQLTGAQLELHLQKIIADLQRESMGMKYGSQDINSLQKVIVRLHQKKPEYAELYQVADLKGRSVTSAGTSGTISDRLYFKEIIKGKQYVFSDSVASMVSGKDILLCAVPITAGARIAGLFGVVIPVDSFKQFIPEKITSEKAEILILSDAGKILYARDAKNRKKIVGKDIIDDGAIFKNTNQLLSADDKTLFQCTFFGNDMIGISEKLNISGWRLVLLLDRAEYYSNVNVIMLQLIVLIILLNMIIGAILFRIIRNISNPIKHVINIFDEVADGEITIRADEYMPDASGNLIISLNKLLEKLTEVAHVSIESSKQLAASSEGLSISSQDLASGAQTQAASIEEASASLEELASSIDMIAQNATCQSELAKATYKSMENLRNIIHTVAEHAHEAMVSATNSTNEAVRGSDFMQNTIEGMNNIDRSTGRITEIIAIIRDISDKVQLLALNAAIEAARAGENGKGFAVVAEEIAKLADKTTLSANEIENYINEGRGEVDRGKHFVDETSQAFAVIIENIKNTDRHVRLIADLAQEQDVASDTVLNHTKKVMEMSEKISLATMEQGQTNREMLSTIETITHLTQSVAANAEEIASTSEEIGAQAFSLNKEIKFFKV